MHLAHQVTGVHSPSSASNDHPNWINADREKGKLRAPNQRLQDGFHLLKIGSVVTFLRNRSGFGLCKLCTSR